MDRIIFMTNTIEQGYKEYITYKCVDLQHLFSMVRLNSRNNILTISGQPHLMQQNNPTYAEYIHIIHQTSNSNVQLNWGNFLITFHVK